MLAEMMARHAKQISSKNSEVKVPSLSLPPPATDVPRRGSNPMMLELEAALRKKKKTTG